MAIQVKKMWLEPTIRLATGFLYFGVACYLAYANGRILALVCTYATGRSIEWLSAGIASCAITTIALLGLSIGLPALPKGAEAPCILGVIWFLCLFALHGELQAFCLV